MNRYANTANAAARMRGITLVELMIVIVVLAILTSLAYPSYQNQVRKTRRADGLSTLMQTAQALERCYTRFSNYTNVNCPVAFPANSPEGHYVVTAPTLNANAFTLSAAPQGPQASDAECGALRLRSDGVQGSQGVDVDANGCW